MQKVAFSFMKNYKFVAGIPARLGSSRLPNKLLLEKNDIPILRHTYNRILETNEFREENIFVLTADEKIIDYCVANKLNYITTSECVTGSDRFRFLAEKVDADFYINIQGDEPLIDPELINFFTAALSSNYDAFNVCARIDSKEADRNSIIKVVSNLNDELIYMSRNLIPFSKEGKVSTYFKQLGLYAYTKRAVSLFRNEKSKLESNEDIEILRLVENNLKVKMIIVDDQNSFSIDTFDDYEKFLRIT